MGGRCDTALRGILVIKGRGGGGGGGGVCVCEKAGSGRIFI